MDDGIEDVANFGGLQAQEAIFDANLQWLVAGLQRGWTSALTASSSGRLPTGMRKSVLISEVMTRLACSSKLFKVVVHAFAFTVMNSSNNAAPSRFFKCSSNPIFTETAPQTSPEPTTHSIKNLRCVNRKADHD